MWETDIRKADGNYSNDVAVFRKGRNLWLKTFEVLIVRLTDHTAGALPYSGHQKGDASQNPDAFRNQLFRVLV